MDRSALPTPRDDAAHSRFVLEHEGAVAELIYALEPDRLILVHTEVPDSIGGRGVGGTLVRAAVERARTDDRTVAPSCPFARRWLHDHPGVADTVKIDWSTARD